MNKQELYISKIKNDVDEKLYYLLMQHLKEVHFVIPRIDDNKKLLEELYLQLNLAVKNLRSETNKYNYQFFLRYTILIINVLLSYNKDRDDLKKIKLEIINDFTKSDYDLDEKIPLKYQMSEVRITYDVGYLIFLIKLFIKNKNWHNALYCFIGVKLIEPDLKDLDKYEKEIFENIDNKILSYKVFEEPKNSFIVLDANVILDKVLYDVGDYKIPHFSNSYYTDLMEKLGNNNKFVILPSVIEEVKSNLKFTIMNVKRTCKYNNVLNEKEIIKTLEKRFNNILNKYKLELNTTNLDLKHIGNFYSKYTKQLYNITINKIEHSKVSHKLRKLAQREGLLPERGDLKLLAETLELKKIKSNVCILSNDKDLYLFNEEIEKEFGIKIYK